MSNFDFKKIEDWVENGNRYFTDTLKDSLKEIKQDDCLRKEKMSESWLG